MACTEEAKLEHFLQWLQVNGAQFRGCNIKYCDSTKGFGIYSTNGSPEDGVLLVVPLDLAITPMRVLQDPLIGAECRAMFEEGEVDDRFLMILFLIVERLRKNSSWKPYLDMLPTTFGNPVWFTDDELLELRGTTLYRATELRKKDLMSVYEDKVKELVKKLLVLDGDSESEVCFEDFLWANSIFWSRALNLPLPHSYVFPQIQDDVGTTCPVDKNSEGFTSHSYSEEPINEIDGKRFEAHGNDSKVNGVTSTSKQEETVWVEGLLPGIDFCNHDLKAVATWEVDGTGSITQIPLSMYLISALQSPLPVDKEVSISYGNKGNEELLYLYGFVVDNNPDDYLMIHYPGEAIQNISFSDFKGQLLVAEKAAMRCLLPKNLLDHGFFPTGSSNCKANNTSEADDRICNFSWSGHRKTPSYLSKLVFPEDFMTALRTIAMKDEEVSKVSAMLEELVGSEGERQPSETEIRTAVWEACGDSGALQLLVDLLQKKMMDLEDSSGTEDSDSELLENACIIGNAEQHTSKEANNLVQQKLMSRNRWCSIVYRRGQKELTRLFLKEAEHALQLSLSEGN
ncbi:protein-lysine N-methyltransferase EFM1 isoform X1 [Gossypium raimondii]|uniref:protein-lysine N-methyltransferase EFM1 isoform X1 n=3 Tax=Gossypium raimondii TaxID=29730 RepID=UPI00227CF0F6|nr:protein-lysine N-methyltransferase EFM1 isoform X1 [Gossypium raimondii]XP_052489662.1 protein-lysine N-methyltransferase EFM1 isoform X1 [Gossypium raimondii]